MIATQLLLCEAAKRLMSRKFILGQELMKKLPNTAPELVRQQVRKIKAWKLLSLDPKLFGHLDIINPEAMEQYMRMPIETMPPVVAVPVEDTGEYELLDGNHRAAVCLRLGIKCPTWVPSTNA